jgi:drug/metabolite transporter (DMT)-like permease
MLKIHFAVVMFGITGLFAKFLNLPSTIIVFGRCIFAVVFLLFCLKIAKVTMRFNSAKDLLRAILSGVTIGVSWYFFFQSIKVSTVAVGLLTYASVAIFTTFIEAVYFKEKPNATDVILASTTFLGVALLVPKFALSDNTTLGIIYGLLAAFTSGLFTVLSRDIVSKYSSIKLAFYQYLTISILFSPFLFFCTIDYSLHNISLIAILGIVFTGFANTLFISGLKNISAAKANIVLTLEPIYGTVLAMILLNETLNMRTVIGGSIVLASALLATSLANPKFMIHYKAIISQYNK